MSDDQQPRAEWVFPEEKKSSKGRVWLIVGLSVLALAIVAALLFLFLPRTDSAPGATPSATPSTTASAPSPSATPTPTESVPATAEPDPEQTPITTPPPASDPDMETFVGQVQPWLDDASTGLSLVAGMSGQEAVQVVDSLQGDAGRLSGMVAPASISSEWYSAGGDYSARLGELRSTVESGGATQGAIENATAALQKVRGLVGL